MMFFLIKHEGLNIGYLFWEGKSSGSLRTEGRWVDALLWLLALPISGLAGGALVFDI